MKFVIKSIVQCDFPQGGFRLGKKKLTNHFQFGFHLEGGKEFKVVAEGLSDKDCYIQGVTLNGKDYPYSALRQKDIMAGGELVLKMEKKSGNWGKELGLDK